MEYLPADPPRPTRPMSVREAVELAHAQFTAGRLDRAAAVCQKILQAVPDQPEALHCLGLVAYHRRQFGEAADLLRRAIELRHDHDDAGYCSDLGLALA